jgi:putative transposase
VVVADECKIQQEPNSCYRWNPKGNTPVVKVNRERRSISIYGGLSRLTNRVIVHFCPWQESKETIAFLDKIKSRWSKLNIRFNRVAPILLIWDGARWHKSKEVKQWLRDNPGIVELMNFPPYSPEFNPQEKVWKAL